jgi:hypothetical protein
VFEIQEIYFILVKAPFTLANCCNANSSHALDLSKVKNFYKKWAFLAAKSLTLLFLKILFLRLLAINV